MSSFTASNQNCCILLTVLFANLAPVEALADTINSNFEDLIHYHSGLFWLFTFDTLVALFNLVLKVALMNAMATSVNGLSGPYGSSPSSMLHKTANYEV